MIVLVHGFLNNFVALSFSSMGLLFLNKAALLRQETVNLQEIYMRINTLNQDRLQHINYLFSKYIITLTKGKN